MANRILRDWTDSETIEQLSWEAEVFFTRLCMKADDFGCYHANIKLLKSALFPLKDITPKIVELMLKECEDAGLIQRYEANNKPYLLIPKFGQRLRIKQSRFPKPDNIVQSDDSIVQFEENRSEVEDEKKLSRTMMQSFFEDFPKSSHFETIQMRTGAKPEILLTAFEEFKKNCRLNYKNFDEFCDHFKNWYNKRPVQTTAKRRNTL